MDKNNSLIIEGDRMGGDRRGQRGVIWGWKNKIK